LANPDYEKIRESGHSVYSRIYLKEQLERTNQLHDYRNAVSSLISQSYFLPQLHGMEHLQVPYWMSELENEGSDGSIAFNHNVYGISTIVSSQLRHSYLPEFDYSSLNDYIGFMSSSLRDASNAFEDMFGYYPESFIATNYIWSENVEEDLQQMGIRIIQSSRYQKMPRYYKSKLIKRNMGEVNRLNQVYLIRNIYFEPSERMYSGKRKLVEEVWQRINVLFALNVPVVLSMHRLNFMGGFDSKNQYENLELFYELMDRVLRKWDDIEFMSSVELGKLILETKGKI
jgi:hypothetical protein